MSTVFLLLVVLEVIVFAVLVYMGTAKMLGSARARNDTDWEKGEVSATYIRWKNGKRWRLSWEGRDVRLERWFPTSKRWGYGARTLTEPDCNMGELLRWADRHIDLEEFE